MKLFVLLLPRDSNSAAKRLVSESIPAKTNDGNMLMTSLGIYVNNTQDQDDGVSNNSLTLHFLLIK